MSNVEPYLWLVVVGTFFGFVYAFGIGANDVANAFASTVASRSLTLKQAIIAASIFEFSGAYFFGAHVTNTIRSKIFNVDLYENEAEVVMLGMFTSLGTAMVVLLTATYMELPVSTTHTIVGCMMGFSIAAKGFESIEWNVVKFIFLSWVISPLVAGVLAYTFFSIIRSVVLCHENAFQRAYYTFPVVLFFGIGIDVFFVLNKGASNLDGVDFKTNVVLTLAISCGSGIVAGLAWVFIVGPICQQRVDSLLAEANRAAVMASGSTQADEENDEGEECYADEDSAEADKEQSIVRDNDKSKKQQRPLGTIDDDDDDGDDDTDDDDVAMVDAPDDEKKNTFARMAQTFADNTYNQDLKTMALSENERAAEIWEAGEVYDMYTEQLFTYLQVITACLNSFAHGANDVANAIAPISALVQIYQSGGQLEAESKVQSWILAYGGLGIVTGLFFYGYRVMKSLGYKMTVLSPSRGACAELAASLFVVSASFLSVPVSSTQAICGAVMGVGCVGGLQNVQWSFFLIVCSSWVIIFVVSCTLSAGLFAMFAYTPSLSQPPFTQDEL